MVLHDDGRRHRHQRVGAVDGNSAAHQRIAQRQAIGRGGQVDVVPDADVAAADAADPVPTHSGVERGIVGTEESAIIVGGLFVLQFGGTRVGTFLNLYRQHVHAVAQVARHVGLAAHEGALDAVHLLAVEPDVGLPVDAVEAEEHALPLHLAGHAELAAIPEVAVEERLARHEQVVVVVGIGQCAGVDVGHEHRGGHRGHHPLRGIKAR